MLRTATKHDNTITAVCLIISLLSFLLTAGGCSSGIPKIEVQEPEAWISPLIIGSGSIFMKIENSGDGKDTLIGAELDVPGSLVELHDVDDRKMIKTDSITVPAKNIVHLRPAGVHIMVFKLPKELIGGRPCTLTLMFAKSGRISVPLQFKSNAINR